MSRIGRLPIPVPAGVEVTLDGQDVTVKGPKGTLSLTVAAPITIAAGGRRARRRAPGRPAREPLACTA